MPSWTTKDAETWMVHAEMADPRKRNPGEARPLTWPDRFVEDPDQRAALKLWVWCKANGYAFSDVCKRRGLSPSTASRRKQAAVERIVMLLNLEQSLKERSNLVAPAA